LPHGLISISGGASLFPHEVEERAQLLTQALVELAFDKHLMLVDGATAKGIMRILGSNFVSIRQTAPNRYFPPLVGFAPEKLVCYPGKCDEMADELDMHHPYFVLVQDAFDWGDEVSCMFRFVQLLTQNRPSVSIIANGGRTTLQEAVNNISANRQMIVFRGSKRAAEVIVSALDGASRSDLSKLLYVVGLIKQEDGPDEMALLLDQLEQIANYKKTDHRNVECFDLHDSPVALVKMITSKLCLA
jgi:hypothetical protein